MAWLLERGSDEPPSIKKLLLVEENLATATRLGERLEQQAGYQVIVASDCLTALKFLRSFKPNLVLLNERLLTRIRCALSTIQQWWLEIDRPSRLSTAVCRRSLKHA